MFWKKEETLEGLEVELAGRSAKLASLRELLDRAKSYSGHYADMLMNLSAEVSVLEYKIKKKKEQESL